MRKIALVLGILVTSLVGAQKTSIVFELNGRPSQQELLTTTESSANPFKKFIGEWTLKNDIWIQNWGSATDTLKIAGHHTISSQLNTDHSLLSIIDGPEPNGHIFWVYIPNTKTISHLSSFGEIRIGVGKGTVDEEGNLSLEIVFEGETAQTYRKYTYHWITDDTYSMRSVQFDDKDRPTGLFYEGVFVRVDSLMPIQNE